MTNCLHKGNEPVWNVMQHTAQWVTPLTSPLHSSGSFDGCSFPLCKHVSIHQLKLTHNAINTFVYTIQHSLHHFWPEKGQKKLYRPQKKWSTLHLYYLWDLKRWCAFSLYKSQTWCIHTGLKTHPSSAIITNHQRSPVHTNPVQIGLKAVLNLRTLSSAFWGEIWDLKSFRKTNLCVTKYHYPKRDSVLPVKFSFGEISPGLSVCCINMKLFEQRGDTNNMLHRLLDSKNKKVYKKWIN